MLYEKIEEALKGSLKPFHPLPDIDDRDAWESLDADAAAHLKELSEGLLSSVPDPIPASLWAEYYLNGTRKNMGAHYFSRRKNLYALCVLECIENSGRYVDKIIDYIWAICEESCWVIPAHMHQNPLNYGKDVPLPPTGLSDNYIDLFCAETASVLCWAKYLVGSRLTKYPAVNERITYEVKRRVLSNLDDIPKMHWSGFVPGKQLNNWTPWICSNLLAVALLEEKDDEKRRRWLLLLAKSLDAFLATYAPDGGCDEGPGYFNRAGASVLDALEIYFTALHADGWKSELVRNMARYIMRAHIDGEYYINFADAACRVKPDALLLRRCAGFTGDGCLKEYSEYLISNALSAPADGINYDGIYRRLRNLIDYRKPERKTVLPERPLSHYFGGVQVFSARRSAGEGSLFMAVKGGHNAESHNHNDVGNFIVYCGGEPFIVDAGVETYSKRTFSELRYEIWTMRSSFHNTAIIDGREQLPGREYAARNTEVSDDGETAFFRCDMAPAYGLENSSKYVRTLMMRRKEAEIEVNDEITLPKAATLALPLLLAVEPELSKGKALLFGKSGKLAVEFDPDEFDAEAERIDLTDGNLRANWQRDALYRLLLTRKDPIREGVVSLRIRAM